MIDEMTACCSHDASVAVKAPNNTVKIDEGIKKCINSDGVYVEDEGRWFEEQGAKCFLQITPRGGIATRGHLHDALELILIESGTFTAYINDRRYVVSSGDLLFFRPSDVHRIYAGENDRNAYYVMKIHPSLVFDVADKKNGAAYMLRFTLGGASAKRVWRRDELCSESVTDSIRRLADECKTRGAYFDIAVKEHAAAVLLFLLRNDTGETVASVGSTAAERGAVEQIYRAITYVNSHYSEDISAYETAREVGMSYSHFSRTFGGITGQSFKDYLNTVRQRRAEELFLTTDKSVAEISEACGYSSVSYFILSFKQRNGMTPGAYKAKIRNTGKESDK